MTASGIYLYGAVLADGAKEFGRIGLDGGPVAAVAEGGIGMVASDAAPVAFAQLAPARALQYLAQHQRVLERVMLDGPVIPLKLGTYADDEAQVRAILRAGRDILAETLHRYAGKVEVDLAAIWADMRAVLAEIAADEAIVTAKASIADPAGASTAQRVRLGQLVKELLDRKNQSIAERLVVSLRSRWRDLVVNPPRDDSAILNAAVLIDRGQQGDLDEMLQELDRCYEGRINFRRVGPLPPYSFATAEVRTLPPARLGDARRALGLGASASLAEIKAAHRSLLHDLHPDRNANPRAAEGLKRVSAAFELLEQYAMNYRHTFGPEADPAAIVTVRSLEDLRAAGKSARPRQAMGSRAA